MEKTEESESQDICNSITLFSDHRISVQIYLNNHLIVKTLGKKSAVQKSIKNYSKCGSQENSKLKLRCQK